MRRFPIAVMWLAGLPLAWAQQWASPPAWNRHQAADQKSGSPTDRGAAVFNNWCSACHAKDPRNGSGTRSLEFKYQGKVPAALEDRTDLTAQAVKLAVRNGIAMMPFYRKTEINDADLEALAAYLSRAKK
jgi:mono/diheme cytochrome c family protein